MRDALKRVFDLGLALVLLVVLLPLILVLCVAIWLQDRHSPFYVGRRVGRGGRPFGMVKFRSMVVGADRSGVMSTSDTDRRITALGRLIRRFKLDEVPQLFNILAGHMSFVGPRPNVASEVALYSEVEQGLLTVRPGITDFASIVFADEGAILAGSRDPDRDYNLLIRPWKSRLGLHYIAVRSLGLDLELMLLTALAVLSRRTALARVAAMLERTGADPDLVRIARRSDPLVPTLPPGVTKDTWEAHLTYE
ncbi:MAG: sugar transferase [Gemmatimonadetes bacterium]|nr:MAG: sugar transferase [Gemmatimonadota bacterium]